MAKYFLKAFLFLSYYLEVFLCKYKLGKGNVVWIKIRSELWYLVTVSKREATSFRND